MVCKYKENSPSVQTFWPIFAICPTNSCYNLHFVNCGHFIARRNSKNQSSKRNGLSKWRRA